jgi:hypothetical protein
VVIDHGYRETNTWEYWDINQLRVKFHNDWKGKSWTYISESTYKPNDLNVWVKIKNHLFSCSISY